MPEVNNKILKAHEDSVSGALVAEFVDATMPGSLEELAAEVSALDTEINNETTGLTVTKADKPVVLFSGSQGISEGSITISDIGDLAAFKTLEVTLFAPFADESPLGVTSICTIPANATTQKIAFGSFIVRDSSVETGSTGVFSVMEGAFSINDGALSLDYLAATFDTVDDFPANTVVTITKVVGIPA